MSRDLPCPWCGLFIRDGIDYHQHLSHDECSVQLLKEAITDLWEQLEEAKLAQDSDPEAEAPEWNPERP